MELSIRPIAIDEVIARVAASAVLCAASPLLPGTLLPQQFGVGSAGGVEPIIRAITHALLRADGEDLAVIHLDLKNAFNQTSRLALLKGVQEFCPSLYRIFKWTYAVHSTLVVFDPRSNTIHRLSSQSGVRQGHPMSPLFFSLAYRPQLTDLLNFLRDQGVPVSPETLVAYLDDTFLTVPVATVESALAVTYDAFEDTGQDRGFILRPDKTAVYLPSSPTGARVLGTCVGNEATRAAFLSDHVRELRNTLARLQERASSQDAQLLLRDCVVPRFCHFLRCLDPAGLSDVWNQVDSEIASAVYHLRGAGPSLDPRQQQLEKLLFSLPLRFGGLGLVTPATVAPIAWEASTALSAREWTQRYDEATSQRLHGAEALGYDDVPKQRSLMSDIWSAKAAEVRELLDPVSRAQLASFASPVGKAWCLSIPVEPQLRIDDNSIAAALHVRTFQRPERDSLCNNCGKPNPPLGHDLSCSARQALRTRRHETIKHLVSDLFHDIGFPDVTRVELEPRSTKISSQRRADLRVEGVAAPTPPSTVFDFSVVNLVGQAAALAIRRAVSRPDNPDPKGPELLAAALEVRFQAKLQAYRDERFQGTFVPFIISPEGAMHPRAAAGLQYLATTRQRTHGRLVRRFYHLLSCALVRYRGLTFFN